MPDIPLGTRFRLFTDTAVLAAKIVEGSTDAPSQRLAQGARAGGTSPAGVRLTSFGVGKSDCVPGNTQENPIRDSLHCLV